VTAVKKLLAVEGRDGAVGLRHSGFASRVARCRPPFIVGAV